MTLHQLGFLDKSTVIYGHIGGKVEKPYSIDVFALNAVKLLTLNTHKYLRRKGNVN